MDTAVTAYQILFPRFAAMADNGAAHKIAIKTGTGFPGYLSSQDFGPNIQSQK